MVQQKKPEESKVATVEFMSKGFVKVVWNVGDIEHAVKLNNPIHMDFQDAVDDLINFHGKYFSGFENGTLSLKKATIAYYENIEGMSVQIKCVHTHDKDEQNSTVSTPKMQVHGSHYGYETELKKAVNVLCEEAWQFAVSRKSAQESIDQAA